MGTQVTVMAPSPRFEEASRAVEGLFAAWEANLSRFDPRSELSRLNRSGELPFPASPLLFRVLETSISAARATGGVFDPTLARNLTLLGYDRTFEEVRPDAPALPDGLTPGGGWRQIRMDPERRTITLPLGVQLDFGGIAKGMAVDEAARLLKDAGIFPAMVNAGGDLAVVPSPVRPITWPVTVESAPGLIVPLRAGALATSSVLKRRWRRGGEELHHLLDPSTGHCASTVLDTVTVAAANCTQAEVAAKVALILGRRSGRSFLLAKRLAGLLASQDGIEAVGAFPFPSRGGEP